MISWCQKAGSADSLKRIWIRCCDLAALNFLAFVGIATNVCVEATLRDGLYRDYLCLLIEDATNETGPSFVKAATVFNVETILGWVTTTEAYCRALMQISAPAAQLSR